MIDTLMAPWVNFYFRWAPRPRRPSSEDKKKSRKRAEIARDPKIEAAHNTFASTWTINRLSFVEWRSIRGEEEEKSFNSIYWTATKYDDSIFYGHY